MVGNYRDAYYTQLEAVFNFFLDMIAMISEIMSDIFKVPFQF